MEIYQQKSTKALYQVLAWKMDLSEEIRRKGTIRQNEEKPEHERTVAPVDTFEREPRMVVIITEFNPSLPDFLVGKIMTCDAECFNQDFESANEGKS